MTFSSNESSLSVSLNFVCVGSEHGDVNAAAVSTLFFCCLTAFQSFEDFVDPPVIKHAQTISYTAIFIII